MNTAQRSRLAWIGVGVVVIAAAGAWSVPPPCRGRRQLRARQRPHRGHRGQRRRQGARSGQTILVNEGDFCHPGQHGRAHGRQGAAGAACPGARRGGPTRSARARRRARWWPSATPTWRWPRRCWCSAAPISTSRAVPQPVRPARQPRHVRAEGRGRCRPRAQRRGQRRRFPSRSPPPAPACVPPKRRLQQAEAAIGATEAVVAHRHRDRQRRAARPAQWSRAVPRGAAGRGGGRRRQGGEPGRRRRCVRRLLPARDGRRPGRARHRGAHRARRRAGTS